jgi:hypothetical protein
MRHALRSIENLEALHSLGPIRPNIARNCPKESQDSPSLRSQWRFGSLPPTGHDPSHVSRQGGFARLIRPIFLERRFRGVEWRPGSSTSRRLLAHVDGFRVANQERRDITGSEAKRADRGWTLRLSFGKSTERARTWDNPLWGCAHETLVTNA